MLRLLHAPPLHGNDAVKIEKPRGTERLTLKLALKVPLSSIPNFYTYCRTNLIDVEPADSSSDYITVRATLSTLETLFGVAFYTYRCKLSGSTFTSFEGVARIPLNIASYTRAIFGLDTAALLRPYAVEGENNNLRRAFTPLQLASIYKFPEDEGEGQTVGIIAFGGGYLMSDIQTFFNMLGLVDTPRLIDVSVNSKNNPNNSSASIETTLDVEILSSLIPKATIRIYFCTATSHGFYEGLRRAVKDECSVISISWGSPERKWSHNELETFNTLFQKATMTGITFVAAAGDSGSSDGLSSKPNDVNADFPASSPYVLACGGTTLTMNEAVGKTDETVWNVSPTAATGGGISSFFIKPGYQSSFSVIGKRGIPDVCANADKNTGYRIIYQGKELVMGGTSAAAPLWAALITRINNIASIRVGLPHSMLYLPSSKSAFNDIVKGNNGAYKAAVGWDPCSGLGSPNGIEILKLWMPGYAMSRDSAKGRLKPPNRNINNPAVKVITVKDMKKPSTRAPPPQGTTVYSPNPKKTVLHTRITTEVCPIRGPMPTKRVIALRSKHPQPRV